MWADSDNGSTVALQASGRGSIPRRSTKTIMTDNVNFKIVNEKFPHIGKSIDLMWGTPECSMYINRLMNDTRDGQRQGFPSEVASALFKLLNVHDSVFPNAALRITDIWQQSYFR